MKNWNKHNLFLFFSQTPLLCYLSGTYFECGWWLKIKEFVSNISKSHLVIRNFLTSLCPWGSYTQGLEATVWQQVSFNRIVPRISLCLLYWPGENKRLHEAWRQPVVLKKGTLVQATGPIDLVLHRIISFWWKCFCRKGCIKGHF